MVEDEEIKKEKARIKKENKIVLRDSNIYDL